MNSANQSAVGYYGWAISSLRNEEKNDCYYRVENKRWNVFMQSRVECI